MTEAVSKNGWTRVAFGDVVRQVRDRVDPDESGLERYVAGEHMATDDLRIRQWGAIDDGYLGPAFHMRFKPGHVLYGSRRTYLRKVAVADFEGITANTTFVLESKDPKVLLPELLPFIMQAESFHEHSIKQSKGSVNPYVNFSDLTWYEFDLPPLEEQQRIAHMLQGATRLQETYRGVLDMLEQLIQRFVLTEFKRALRTAPLLRVTEIAEIKMGRQKAPKYAKGLNPKPFLRVANVGDLELTLDIVEEMDFTGAELDRYRLMPGDILLTEGDLISQLNVGRPAVFRGEISDCCFQNTLIRLRPRAVLDSRYGLLVLEAARLAGVFARAAKTTTVTHLGLGRLSAVELPVPPLPEQQVAARQFMGLLESRTETRGRIRRTEQIQSALCERVLT